MDHITRTLSELFPQEDNKTVSRRVLFDARAGSLSLGQKSDSAGHDKNIDLDVISQRGLLLKGNHKGNTSCFHIKKL